MSDKSLGTLLGVGIALFASLLLGGAGVLFFGRLFGGAVRGKRHAKGAPASGSVPAERQQHVGTSSPR
ncbi:MAG: hypothetical protein IVW55_00020 [Chloroflexi bacterium]|nr:hypothetical protein [Chloroflexota bacterium]